MSRLTYKSESGMTWFVDEEGRRLEPCEMSPHHSRLAIEKLAHYEDLEEAGRLIELPCKVGDTVWIVGEPRECVIEEIRITPNGIFIEYVQYDKSPELTELWDEGSFCIEDIGKEVFLTKAEAEVKLAELKGEIE